jgi:Holliday junction resolvasome RuvABC endonuclease subunit
MEEEPIILGIDPGTKEMGLAVLQGHTLLAADVKTLRNGERPHDVIGQARRVVLEYVQDYNPTVVGIEQPLFVATKRAALVSVIAQELESRSREVGIRVVEISAREVRRIVVGNPYAKKREVAEAIVGMGFGSLRVNLPKEPPHPVFGYKPRDRYWLHMFDAVAVALACARSADRWVT